MEKFSGCHDLHACAASLLIAAFRPLRMLLVGLLTICIARVLRLLPFIGIPLESVQQAHEAREMQCVRSRESRAKA